MKLKKIIDKINDSGRITNEMSREEMIDCLDAIANDITSNNTTLLHANTLIAIRHGLMNKAERFVDYAKSEAELKIMAQSLGRKGGQSTSEAKQKASRENGKKGGRPRKKCREL